MALMALINFLSSVPDRLENKISIVTCNMATFLENIPLSSII
jgi:hypothetical protein